MGVANSCGAVVQGCASYYVSRLLPHRRDRMSKYSVATFFSSIMVSGQNSLETRLLLRL